MSATKVNGIEVKGQQVKEGQPTHAHHYSWVKWDDFLADATGPVPEHVAHPSSRDGDDGWAGGSWADACTLAVDGWHETIPEADIMAKGIAHTVTGDRAGVDWSFPRDVSGEMVDVGLYLAGEPECMVDPVPTSAVRQGQVVRLAVPVNYSAGTPEWLARERGIAIVALIDCLRRNGCVLEVWATCDQRGNSHRTTYAVQVQDPRDPVDIGRIMFAVAHPTMLRRVLFGAMERLTPRGKAEAMGIEQGYGRPRPMPIEMLPEVDGPTISLPMLQPGDDWSPETAIEWIEASLDVLAG